MSKTVSFAATLHVRDTCLCLHAQRAARVMARRFDAALRPAGLTNAQFSLWMALNRPEPPQMRELARLLGADRTTLTAALKPLARRGLVETRPDAEDRRIRRAALTDQGRASLATAMPFWRTMQAAVETELGEVDPSRLRRDLCVLAASGGGQERGA